MFKPGADVPTNYGPNRNWNVDLIPKFVMAGGKFLIKKYDIYLYQNSPLHLPIF